jgi:hypothetical protein
MNRLRPLVLVLAVTMAGAPVAPATRIFMTAPFISSRVGRADDPHPGPDRVADVLAAEVEPFATSKTGDEVAGRPVTVTTRVVPRLRKGGAEMTASGMVRGSWVLAVAFFVVTGLWPLVSPDTFFDALVTFPLTAAGAEAVRGLVDGITGRGGSRCEIQKASSGVSEPIEANRGP